MAQSQLNYYNGYISRLFDCSITVYYYMSAPLITYHQQSQLLYYNAINKQCLFYGIALLHVNNTVITAVLECHQYTLIVLLQFIAIICQSINPDCFWKPIKLLRTHPVDAEISDNSYKCLAKSHINRYKQVQYICIRSWPLCNSISWLYFVW